MICFKVNPSPPTGWESDAKRVRREQRSAVRRWIDEREVVLFRGTLSDLRDVQREEGHEADSEQLEKTTREVDARRRRRRRLEEDGGWVVDRRQISDSSAITHVPLSTILLSPFNRLSRSLTTLLTPSHRLLTSYVDSFGDGTQSRVAAAAWNRARNGEVWEFTRRLASRVLGVWVKAPHREEESPRPRPRQDERDKPERKD